jgi:hypothetical protein
LEGGSAGLDGFDDGSVEVLEPGVAMCGTEEQPTQRVIKKSRMAATSSARGDSGLDHEIGSKEEDESVSVASIRASKGARRAMAAARSQI